MFNKRILLTAVLFSPLVAHGQAITSSVTTAPKIKNTNTFNLNTLNQTNSLDLASKAWGQSHTTVDCGCQYEESYAGGTASIKPKGCGYYPRLSQFLKPSAQWSRVIPLSRLSLGRACTAGAPPCHDKDGHALFGTECCTLIDPEFQKMSNDAWNWIPMIDNIAQDRGDDMFDILAKGYAPYGKCPLKIDPENEVIEPVDSQKGIIARTMLYFITVWHVPFTPAQVQTYKNWDKDHPPTAAERYRALVIDQAQGIDNPAYGTINENNTAP